MASILSVNVGTPQPLAWNGRSVTTGIVKSPVIGDVLLRTRGLDGDGQADLRVHGRPFQAVYVYPHEHYSYWQGQLERDPFPMGQFGENLTTEGLLETNVCLGDVFRIGTALVQVTSYRIPCGKFAMRMQSKDFPRLFLESMRCGWYMRVIEEGAMKAGDTIELKEHDETTPNIEEMLRAYLTRPVDVEEARRVLAVESLAEPVRVQFKELVSGITW